MTSRKYEKASDINCSSTTTPQILDSTTSSSSSTSFWKKSPIAGIPGRINLSSGSHSSLLKIKNPSPSLLLSTNTSNPSSPAPDSTSAEMPASFRAFEASVSDAWDANDDTNFNTNGTATNRVITTNAVPTSRITSRNLATSTTVTSTNGRFYPTTEGNNRLQHQPRQQESDQYGTGSKAEKVEKFLSGDNVDLETLRKLSWSGLAPNVRSKVWKILCGYLPATSVRRDDVLQRKQDEYSQYVNQYFKTKDTDVHQETYRQIHIDIPRMSPVISLFQQLCVQEIFERILYIWAIRHPASGYVQGINDLVTPFFLVFLQDYCQGKDISSMNVSETLTEKEIQSIEADSFWCLTKVLGGIQDNYTFAQPGIQLKVKQLEELVQRIDQELHNHLTQHEVLYLQFAFRWMNNILMRELPIKATIRLWDTYLSEIEGFSHFHLYVCAAFLIHWKSELMKKTDFHTLLMFLQNLPTAKWGDKEINLLVAEAFRLSYLFADAPKHLSASTTPALTTSNK